MSIEQLKAVAINVLSGLGGRARAGQIQGALDCSDDDLRNLLDALEDEGVIERDTSDGVLFVELLDNETDSDEDEDTDEEDEEDEQAEDEEDDDFELTSPEPSGTRHTRNKPGKKKSKASGDAKKILSYRHSETRVNNPEVGMVDAASDPAQPKTDWQYDPHLDPVLNFDSARAQIEVLIDGALASGDEDQMRDALLELKRMQQPYLNWTGKAERTSFEIDTVSLHVHERIDPATILSSVARKLKGEGAAAAWQQTDLFAPHWENVPLRQAIDFYRHEKGWSNRLVAGDSLLVMNSLLTKESMGGKVQMVYIDPPYGIKYGSNFQPFTNKRDVKDRSDNDLTQEPEMIKAFRDTWELGIHSYLTYLRDRLMLARELLTESGSVFVQISDENLHHVRELMDEIFGVENFCSIIQVQKTGSQAGNLLATTVDFLVWYARDKSAVKYRQIYLERVPGHVSSDRYDQIELPTSLERRLTKAELNRESDIPEGQIFQHTSLISSGQSSYEQTLQFFGKAFDSGAGNHWKTTMDGMARLYKAGRISDGASTIRYKRYLDDFPVLPISDRWESMQIGTGLLYVVQTSASVIERCTLMTTDPGDLVLDPTCGSGTTAFVAEKWGRRWITCDTSRVAITLAKQRLMTASFDYYALRFPNEGLGGGFDYETVPHITLKSIANNPDIDTIYDEDHPKIAAALADLNAALTASPPKPLKPTQGVRKGKPVDFAKGDTLDEWEVPFDWPEGWPEDARMPFETFHAVRQAMQRRMNQSIADHADQETLYDKPRIDKDKLRITGPFSVEAVPAPTVMSLNDEAGSPSEADASIGRSGETSRQKLWREELLKTGVRAKGGTVMRFSDFETVPGLRYIHASGNMMENGDRIVVSFGPEHAALEQRQVELAIEEAGKLVPKPKFVLFCAFTFDPEAAKDIDEMVWPGVTLLKAQMNTDLLTEDLKKQRASNESFWLMGQPDVESRKREDGLWEVEVNGFDYFDPKKGELISGGKKKIAMWSLDTDYDGRSLMPHQVFFPMMDQKSGWNRLKKTIRAELDEDLLEQYAGTTSIPFAAGENKRIAVKIVDDRGIESLKIIPLEA